MKCHVKDKGLHKEGKLKIEWAAKYMPVLDLIKKRFKKEKPLKGKRVSACLHVTTETANLMLALKEAGANIVLCASNPLSTQDDVAASLVMDFGIPTFAIKGEDNKTYYSHIKAALDHRPVITMDDGADIISTLHKSRRDQIPEVLGSTEETTTGVIRLKSMEKDKVLAFPVIAVNDAKTKHLFDNRYGTGQSTIDGILRATNILFAGAVVVVCGYGMCGKGVVMRASGMGSKIVVVETDPIRGLEATMDGFDVMPIADAAKIGDVFITVTGDISVIRKEHFLKMKDGAIVANSGHFNVEIDLEDLKKISRSIREMRPFVEEYTLKSGKKINVLGGGRLINLSAAEGHPAMVMDMSFANQALSAEFLSIRADSLENKVYSVPEDIDKEIARLKLISMGVKIDKLTPRQEKYLASWEEGT